MSFDLSIHGRVYGDGVKLGWLYVKRGRIARLSREPVGSAAAEIRLLDSQFLLPAATDLHVHLRDWSQSRKETVETGTKSALAGGVTTVADMPNTEPRIDSANMVEKRIDLLRSASYADFALHSSPPESPRELRRLRKAGAFAIKFYPPELGRLPDLLKETMRAGLKVAVHAEDFGLTGTPRAALAESVAVRRILGQLGRSSEVRFAHVSTFDGASELQKVRPAKRRLTAEVTPHHLFMSAEAAEERIGLARKVNPSLRSASNCSRMRALMKTGAFDFFATDHAPHTVEEKLEGAPGFPALEFALPLFLTKTRDVELVSRMYCEAPARYLGIPKGKIAEGYLADLVVIGRRRWRIDPERFVTKGRVTPFAGETMTFSIDHVLKGGSTVYEPGRFTRVPPVLATHEHVH